MNTLCGSFEDETKQVSDIGPFSAVSMLVACVFCRSVARY
jgi:hypothetical protein